MRIATATEAKNRLSGFIDAVRSGETAVIVDRGIPVAQLESARPVPDDAGRLARLQRSGAVQAEASPLPADLLTRRRPKVRGNVDAVAP
ncbi:MAG: type II toxin-antitoxin system prevent-host-death family antitoxin [Actinobacteria bacterium]|nr:type II toxin-antitoxin system prevent-host-death family antitoxin [Actinomycetota bacterium]